MPRFYFNIAGNDTMGEDESGIHLPSMETALSRGEIGRAIKEERAARGGDRGRRPGWGAALRSAGGREKTRSARRSERVQNLTAQIGASPTP
jgi:hypothetical protein